MNTFANTVQAERGATSVRRAAIFFYGAGSYALFLATFLYAIGFIGNFGVPKSIDSQASVSWRTALMVDLGLLSLFAFQHSVMARQAFKRWITRIVPPSAERSTFVLASSLALALLFWKWQPLGGIVWNVESAAGRILLYAGFGFGWGLVLVATFVINHFDLFGLRQVWRELKGQPQARLQFVAPLLYRIVRHPLYVGWMLVFWSAPTMTISHLFFAMVTTAYILVAIRFEEADLMREHPEYAVYRKQVPMLIPRIEREVSFAPADRNAVKADATSRSRRAASLIAIAAIAVSWQFTARGQTATAGVPPNLRVPDGNVFYLKASAVGTQNYICSPGASGAAWKLMGPQATLFITFPWFGGQARQQIATHYLSANPAEGGTARPTWQHSLDTSAVWGKAIASSTDPLFVAPGSIPWLLVEVVGGQRGPMGGSLLAQTTYIQRLNTSGGVAPSGGCDESSYGAVTLAPYTTDYYFYQAETRK